MIYIDQLCYTSNKRVVNEKVSKMVKLKFFSKDFKIEGCCECPLYYADTEECEHSAVDGPKKILGYTEARKGYFGFAEWCPLADVNKEGGKKVSK